MVGGCAPFVSLLRDPSSRLTLAEDPLLHAIEIFCRLHPVGGWWPSTVRTENPLPDPAAMMIAVVRVVLARMFMLSLGVATFVARGA